VRKNFGAKCYLYPQPVMIIGTYDENGNPDAMNAAWGGITGFDEISIDLGKHKTTDNIALTKCFSVGIADSEHTAQCDYLGIVSGNEVPDKISKCGFTTVKSEFVNAPIINELPLTLECELKEIHGSLYVGKIINASCDEKFCGEDGLPDLSKFNPITFDPVRFGYYALGERVGNAFSDGNILKNPTC